MGLVEQGQDALERDPVNDCPRTGPPSARTVCVRHLKEGEVVYTVVKCKLEPLPCHYVAKETSLNLNLLTCTMEITLGLVCKLNKLTYVKPSACQ